MSATSLALLPPDPAGALPGTQRAAVLLVSLGVEVASRVLPLLSDAEIERVSVEIARLRGVPAGVVEAVLSRFQEDAHEPGDAAQGGKSVVEELLTGAFGAERAGRVLAHVEAATEKTAFELVEAVETGALGAFLAGEHPQTVAVVLGRLSPAKAGALLKSFEASFRGDVSYRLATAGEPAPEVVAEIDAALRAHLSAGLFSATTRNPAQHVATILGSAGRRVSGEVMEALRARAPELAGEVKGFMFVFDDFERVADRDLQRVLAEVDQRVLALALKGAAETLADRMLSNVSERMRDSIREEMDFMGPARVSDVEDAQQTVVDRAQALEEQGLIALAVPSESAAEAMI